MRFPKRVTFGKRGKATIYGKSESCRLYRVAGYVGAKRQITYHADYPSALAKALEVAKAINDDSKTLALTPAQAKDALLALEAMVAHKRKCGQEASLHTAVAEWVAAAAKLGKRPLHEAVDTYLRTAAVLNRSKLTDAVERLIVERAAKTQVPAPQPGKPARRPKLSQGHHYNTAMWLREFAQTFPGDDIDDLTSNKLALYIDAFQNKVSARTRNARRKAIKLLLHWCMADEQRFLPNPCPILEAAALKFEDEEEERGESEFYTPKELAAILQAASEQEDFHRMLPLVAIVALAGLRQSESCRLVWEKDVFKTAGHIQVTASGAKTRSRRLVQIRPTLAQWLEPYRAMTGKVWLYSEKHFEKELGRLVRSIGLTPKDNGLRHGYGTFRYTQTQNDTLVAAEMGNSPDMVHKHYKGLATSEEAERWFAVAPAPAAANVVPISAAVA